MQTDGQGIKNESIFSSSCFNLLKFYTLICLQQLKAIFNILMCLFKHV